MFFKFLARFMGESLERTGKILRVYPELKKEAMEKRDSVIGRNRSMQSKGVVKLESFSWWM